jgi:adenosylcobinamide kinase/adenosylcobinamide-phosphate guanylyltransferase|uniref:bifunctional adenosylcobinamide kinase/adenosylcobinamide-phosphate guanylyltransferase n=1 Tax=Agathobacter sp. TaxID=2021311 RepID=UPI0040279EC0
MIHLVIGGSGSGKSEFAENLLEDSQRKYYIATMQVYEEEGRKKVARHRRLRAGKGFQTIEQPRDMHKVAEIVARDRKETENAALLECMSNLVANEMFGGETEDSAGWMSETERKDFLVEKVTEGIRVLAEKLDKLVIVSNNVFEDGISYDAQTMSYIRVLGRVNQELARMADHVTEVVVGIPVKVK